MSQYVKVANYKPTAGEGDVYGFIPPAIFGPVRLAAAVSGVYHGLKRNRGSIKWAVGWGLLGGIFPIVTIPVSLAQGFGKPKK